MFLRSSFTFRIIFLTAIALSALTSAAAAQSTHTRPRQVLRAEQEQASPVENPLEISLPSFQEIRPRELPILAGLYLPRPEHTLFTAINSRLGAPYVYGATGPRSFDCSGFVWSVFRSVGISFDRSNARTLWTRFAPARESEKSQFGTLVFFNNLKHVGIVADAAGFYHASSSQGVTYSRFSDYWLNRLDGFRRVPLLVSSTPALAE